MYLTQLEYRSLKLAFALFLCLEATAIAKEISYYDMLHVARLKPRVLFYFVSGGMPLSEPGLENIRRAAKNTDFELQVLHDPLTPLESEKDRSLAKLSAEFRKEGVFLHFPSLLLYRNGKRCGSAVAGYKDAGTYQEIIQMLEERCESPTNENVVVPEFNLATVTVVKETILPRKIRYFYHPIGLDWIAYHTGKANYLFNRRTGREILLPGRYDIEPTPDEAYVTIPAQKNPPDLSFYSLARILAGPDDQSNIAPDYHDPLMLDQYQSAGYFRNFQNRFYRLMTAWFSSIQLRDYHVQGSQISAQGSPRPVCSNLNLSTPMLSQNGRRVGALNNDTGTTHVLDIGINGDTCEVVRNLGIKTGKVSIDSTGNRVAYDSVINNTAGVFVENLTCQNRIKLGEPPQGGYAVFPKFLKNGNYLYLKVKPEGYSLVEVKVRT